MEFHIRLDRPIREPDALDAAIRDVDPAATVAIDPLDGRLRVSTWIGVGDLLDLLRGRGHMVETWQMDQLPSVCCGSCSG